MFMQVTFQQLHVALFSFAPGPVKVVSPSKLLPFSIGPWCTDEVAIQKA